MIAGVEPGMKVRVLKEFQDSDGPTFGEVYVIKESPDVETNGEITIDHRNEGWFLKTGEFEIVDEEDDPVNPKHYADLGEYAAIYVIERWGLGFNLGQTLKYIQRAGTKPGEPELRDIEKAAWYLQRHLHELDPEKHADPARKES